MPFLLTGGRGATSPSMPHSAITGTSTENYSPANSQITTPEMKPERNRPAHGRAAFELAYGGGLDDEAERMTRESRCRREEDTERLFFVPQPNDSRLQEHRRSTPPRWSR